MENQPLLAKINVYPLPPVAGKRILKDVRIRAMAHVRFLRKGLYVSRGRVPKCGRVVQNVVFLSCPSWRASAHVAGTGGAFRGREWGTPGQWPATVRGLFSINDFYRDSEQVCSSTVFFFFSAFGEASRNVFFL